jgi:hypothetical protein
MASNKSLKSLLLQQKLLAKRWRSIIKATSVDPLCIELNFNEL